MPSVQFDINTITNFADFQNKDFLEAISNTLNYPF